MDTGNDYCGTGCKAGPCYTGTTPSPSTGSGTAVSSVISKDFFDPILSVADGSCAGKNFYTYDGFIQAANAYSGFGTTGTSDEESARCLLRPRHPRDWMNFNYGPAGNDIGFDGLNEPEKVANDATISFKTAVWFWMKNSNCHTAITSGQGFGATIQAVNGSIECNGGNTDAVNKRVTYYKNYCAKLVVDPGSNLSC